MSFGKWVVVSRTGGMDEYASDYGASVVVEPDVDPAGLLSALTVARSRSRAEPTAARRPGQLEWKAIVGGLLADLERLVPAERASGASQVTRTVMSAR